MTKATIKWANPDSPAITITIDKLRRLYISAEARHLLCVETPFKLFVGYDKVNKRLVVSRPDLVKLTDVKPFSFDKRGYSHAKSFVSELMLKESEFPVKYEFVGSDLSTYPHGVFSFQKEDFAAPDDKGKA